MKYLPFSLSLVAGLALIWVLSTRWGNIPPMGPFMDPDGGFLGAGRTPGVLEFNGSTPWINGFSGGPF